MYERLTRWRAWAGRLAFCLVLLVAAALAHLATACSSPFLLASSFEFEVVNGGTLTWNAATASANTFMWSPTLASPKFSFFNFTGPPVYFEAIQIFPVSRSIPNQDIVATVPVRAWACGDRSDTSTRCPPSSGTFLVEVPDLPELYGIEFTPAATESPGTRATMPKQYVFKAAVLWKNSLGNRNYENGQGAGYSPACACYPTADDRPYLDRNAREAYAPVQRFSFSVFYQMGTISGGTGGGGGVSGATGR